MAVDLGLEQHPDEVVARLLLALGDQRVDVGLGVAHGLALVVPVEERVREHPLDPVEPALLVLLRQVHEPRERAERHRVRELGHDVAAAVARDRLEQPRRERLEVRAQRIDARPREERVDEPAVARVLRRVELDREQRVLRGCDGGMTVVPTTADVNDSWSSAAARHVVVAREQPEAAVEVRVHERLLLADRADHALGILDEPRVVVVEAHAAHLIRLRAWYCGVVVGCPGARH